MLTKLQNLHYQIQSFANFVNNTTFVAYKIQEVEFKTNRNEILIIR